MKPFTGKPTDYSGREHWLARPDHPDKPVDLLFLYPSSCRDPKAGIICPVDSRSMARWARLSFSMQATAFEPVANLYAPFWRQVNAAKLSKMSFEEVDQAEWAEPRTDVFAALDYYFEHLNQGRPYFLAGHSQGSRLCYIVLSEYMKEHPEYYERMIAAYCLGDSLTKQYLADNPHVKAAKAADDLGVVISFDCEAPEVTETIVNPAGQKAYSINPLNWKTDGTPADKSENIGACFTGYKGEIKKETEGLCGCYIDEERGVLKVTDVTPEGYPAVLDVFPKGAYHIYDYQFFFRNLQENVGHRVELYMEQVAAADQAA